jgi:hypothetical protein
MNLRKKIFILVLPCLIFSSIVIGTSSVIQLEPPTKYDTFGKLIEAIIDFFIDIAFVLVPLFIVIAGFYFVTASGDPAKIKTGQDIIKYTLIGLLIILLARGLIAVIQSVLGVQ